MNRLGPETEREAAEELGYGSPQGQRDHLLALVIEAQRKHDEVDVDAIVWGGWEPSPIWGASSWQAEGRLVTSSDTLVVQVVASEDHDTLVVSHWQSNRREPAPWTLDALREAALEHASTAPWGQLGAGGVAQEREEHVAGTNSGFRVKAVPTVYAPDQQQELPGTAMPAVVGSADRGAASMDCRRGSGGDGATPRRAPNPTPRAPATTRLDASGGAERGVEPAAPGPTARAVVVHGSGLTRPGALPPGTDGLGLEPAGEVDSVHPLGGSGCYSWDLPAGPERIGVVADRVRPQSLWLGAARGGRPLVAEDASRSSGVEGREDAMSSAGSEHMRKTEPTPRGPTPAAPTSAGDTPPGSPARGSGAHPARPTHRAAAPTQETTSMNATSPRPRPRLTGVAELLERQRGETVVRMPCLEGQVVFTFGWRLTERERADLASAVEERGRAPWKSVVEAVGGVLRGSDVRAQLVTVEEVAE